MGRYVYTAQQFWEKTFRKILVVTCGDWVFRVSVAVKCCPPSEGYFSNLNFHPFEYYMHVIENKNY